MTSGAHPRGLVIGDCKAHLAARENAGVSVANNNVAEDASDGEVAPKKGGFSGFAAAGLSVEDPPDVPDEEEDFGGLMVRDMSFALLAG